MESNTATATDTEVKSVKARPVCCAKGHQIYLMYFLDLGSYGFGCGTCKTFSLEIENAGKILEVKVNGGN